MSGPTRPARGQSAIDFVVGFGVFVLAFSFVVTLIPELFDPFATQETPAVAGRAADTLSRDLLAGQAVGTLNATCAREFFVAAGTSCGFDASDPTPALLGLSDRYTVNATLERPASSGSGTEVACYDGTSVVDCSSGGDRLARGPPAAADSRTVRTARRVVVVADDPLTLRLRVW